MPKASRWPKSMFRSGGTATTATTGTVAGTIPTPQLASAQVVSPSAHGSAAAWRLPRLNGTTAAGSRAGSVAATNLRAMLGHRIDKTVAGVGMALPARLQYVAQQEQSRELKAGLQAPVRPAVQATFALAQELWQPQQPVAPGIAGLPRHRAAGFRRDIDQVGGRAGRRAVLQIKPKPEFGQHRQFELHQTDRGFADVV